MITLTDEQFEKLKDLIEKAEPNSDEYDSGSHYRSRCCNNRTCCEPEEHRETCPKEAWYALLNYLDELASEETGNETVA